jgi:hypothetical protein
MSEYVGPASKVRGSRMTTSGSELDDPEAFLLLQPLRLADSAGVCYRALGSPQISDNATFFEGRLSFQGLFSNRRRV